MSLAMDNREGLGGDAGQGALPLTNAENDRVILLLGAPRSGTTWLAKSLIATLRFSTGTSQTRWTGSCKAYSGAMSWISIATRRGIIFIGSFDQTR